MVEYWNVGLNHAAQAPALREGTYAFYCLPFKRNLANPSPIFPPSHCSGQDHPLFQYSNRTTCLSRASRSNERLFGPERLDLSSPKVSSTCLKAEGLSTGCERSELSFLIGALCRPAPAKGFIRPKGVANTTDGRVGRTPSFIRLNIWVSILDDIRIA